VDTAHVVARLTVVPTGLGVDDGGSERRRPVWVAAAATFRSPWPSTNGLPTGPGDAVPRSRALTWSGVPGWASRTSAAAPLVIAVLNDVPDPTKLAVPIRA
jgi:hypothetical protein